MPRLDGTGPQGKGPRTGRGLGPCNLTIGTKIVTTPFRFGNVKTDKNNYIISIEEKPELKFEILAGIYFLKPRILKQIPKDTYFGIDTLIKKMLNKKLKISKFLINEYWLDVGQVEDYQKARKEVSRLF